MLVKTSELTGPALDWAIAKCEKIELYPAHMWKGKCVPISDLYCNFYQPSFDWAQGGPIIENQKISLIMDEGDTEWQAVVNAASGSMFGPGICGDHYVTGSTPLIAAMRCYVASKLGDEVEIPEELC